MSLKSKVPGETGEMEEPQTGDVQILLTSKEDPVSMRSLGVSGFFCCHFSWLESGCAGVLIYSATLFYQLGLILA